MTPAPWRTNFNADVSNLSGPPSVGALNVCRLAMQSTDGENGTLLNDHVRCLGKLQAQHFDVVVEFSASQRHLREIQVGGS